MEYQVLVEEKQQTALDFWEKWAPHITSKYDTS